MVFPTLLFLCSLIGVVFSVPSGNMTGEISPRSLTYIGNYNGHMFYQAELTTTNSYSTATSRCTSQGMKLAKIISNAEITYLRPLLPVQGADYLTSARSATASFTWADGTNVIPTISHLAATCLYIRSGGGSVYNQICTTAAYTLCDNSI